MPSSRYPLRSRTTDPEDQPTPVSPNSDLDAAEVHTPVRRSYSDVVASRPPSPSFAEGPEAVFPPPDFDNQKLAVKGDGSISDDNLGSLGVSDTQEDKNNNKHFDTSSEDTESEGLWTTVKSKSSKKRKAAIRPRDSYEELMHAKKRAHEHSEINSAIKEAEKFLTKEEKERINRRNKKLRRERSPSLGEGTSKNKGKTIDPREWGNAGIPESELRSKAQKRAFEEAKKAKNTKNRSLLAVPATPIISQSISSAPGIRFDHTANRARLARNEPLPVSARPVAHINPKSFLGTALNHGKSKNKPRKKYKKSKKTSLSSFGDSEPSSESSPSDSSSDSSDSSSSDDSDSSDSSSDLSKSDKRKQRKKSRKTKVSTSSGKAFKPNLYDGRAEPRAYHRFVKESRAYIEDGGFRKKRRILALSYFLEGKAYDYYLQKAATQEETMSMSTFYEGLFNYCFPIDYRQRIRRKFENATQGSRKVSEYIYYLEEQFNLLGSMTESDLVSRFWNNSADYIQRGLWRDGLHPDSSTWDEVVRHAEIIEISENVGRNYRGRQWTSVSRESEVQSQNRRTDYSRHKRVSETASDKKDGNSEPTEHSESDSDNGQLPTLKDYSNPKSYVMDKQKMNLRNTESNNDNAKSPTAGRFRSQGNSVKLKDKRTQDLFSFNLQPALNDNDTNSDSSDDYIEVLDSLPLGAIICEGSGSSVLEF